VLTIREMSKDLEAGRELYPETDYYKPRMRAECIDSPRPCPYVSCQHHLYLDVTEAGSIKINFPDVEVEDMNETCALDIADRGGMTLDEVGDIMNLTRERARQIEAKGLMLLKPLLSEDGPRRRLPILPARALEEA
jgi:hypothetical protein